MALDVPGTPAADAVNSPLPTIEDARDVDGEPGCNTFCVPGGDTAGLTPDEEGEKLKEEADIADGVATGGAEGNGLKLVEGEVDRAVDDTLEGDEAIVVDIPSTEVSESDLPCVPLLCTDKELERWEPEGTW